MAKNNRKGNIGKREKRKLVKYKLGYHLIVVDTQKTERIYIEGLKKSLPDCDRDNIKIVFIQTRTQDMINKCIEKMNYNSNISDAWLVFDRDEVDKFDSIIQEAENNGINVAWSNPCFEIWLHSYFGKLPTSNDSQQCIQKFKDIYNKSVGKKYTKTNNDLYEKLNQFGDEKKAITIHRKKHSDYKTDDVKNPSKMNICSTMYLLVESLKKFSV